MAFRQPRPPHGPAAAATPRRWIPSLPEQRPDNLLRSLAVVILMLVWRLHGINPILEKAKPTLLAVAVALALWAADKAAIRRLIVTRGRLITILLVLLGLMVVGIPGSLVATKSAMFLFTEAMPNFLVVVLIASSVRSMRDLEWLAFVMVAGSIIFSIDKLTVRAIGRYYDRNDTALVLVCQIPFCLFFLRPGTPAKRRLIAAAALVLLLMALVKGASRGGFLGLLAIALYVLIAYRSIPLRTKVLGIVAGAMILAAAGPTFWTRMSTLLTLEEDYNWSGNSRTGRIEVWKRGLGYMAQNPIFGVGLRNFPQAEGRSELALALSARGAGFKWSVAHNSFIEFGAEVGVIGLGLFISLFVLAFLGLRRVGRGVPGAPAPPRVKAFTQALIGSLMAYCICGFLLSAEHFTLLYVLFGMTAGIEKLDRLTRSLRPAPAAGPVPAPAPPRGMPHRPVGPRPSAPIRRRPAV